MKEYDVIVVGSGSGTSIVETALNHEKEVALIDKGPVGGTCLNLGCIPSKMLIYPADVLSTIRDSEKLGISANVESVEFKEIMERMNQSINKSQKKQIEGIKATKNLDLYNKVAKFIDDYTLKVGEEKLLGERIFLASGARPLIPPIDGINEIDYLTNESILELRKKPESVIIIGGGYISAEYSHFLTQMGVDVSIIQRNSNLIPNEEEEMSKKLEEIYEGKMNVLTDTEAVEVHKDNGFIKVIGRDQKSDEEVEVRGKELMIAAGRKSNADLLNVQETGVETDENNFIKVNKKFETSKENIWAIGDAIGKEMFKHVANREASIAAHNAFHDEDVKMDYRASPHAVFSDPQIASVGLKESEAKKQYDEVLIGEAHYSDVAKGEAMMDEKGFAKGIVEAETGKIIGFHIIGSFAPILIQEVVNAMANDLSVSSLYNGMHIHPAMPEIVLRAFGRLKKA